MKKILLIMVMTLAVSVLKAQGFNPLDTLRQKYNTTPFIGQWEAKAEDMTYLITIEETIDFLEPVNVYVETLFGGIVTRKGNTVIRDTKADSPYNSILNIGNVSAPKECTFNFNDKEKQQKGDLSFKLDENDHTKAYWTLRKDGRSRGDLDYPLKMTFFKVENTTR